jgi:hypothetical protein
LDFLDFSKNFLLVPSFSVEYTNLFVMAKFKSVTIKQIIATGILGFSLSLLMFLVCLYDLIWMKKNFRLNYFRIKILQELLSILQQISLYKKKCQIQFVSFRFYIIRLKKGKAFHVDLFVIAILNGWLSLFGLTWMHG